MTLAAAKVVVTPLLRHLRSRQLVWIRAGKTSKHLRDAAIRTGGQAMETVARSDGANINQINVYPSCPSDLRHLRQ